MRLRPILSALLAAAVAFGLFGCDAIKKAITPAPIIKHVAIAPKVGQPGATVVGSLKAGAPANLPLWEGSNVLRSGTTKSDVGSSWSAILSTTDEYQDVVKGMAVGFQRSGWQVQEAEDAGSGEASATALTVSGPSAMGVVTISVTKDKTTRIGYLMTESGK